MLSENNYIEGVRRLKFLGTGKMGLKIGYRYKTRRTKSGCEHIFQSVERWRHSAPYNDPRNTSI
jgi:hypothetical protein